jgi:ketosteroid isomerase-like protein
MSTNQSALAVVQEVFRCFAAHDVEGLIALLDDNIEWHEPDVDVPWRGIYHGHNGFVNWFNIIGRELSDLTVQTHDFIPTEDAVVVIGHESARVTATGRTYHSDFAFVFRVRQGRISSFRAYHDTAAMIRAVSSNGS